MSTTPKTLLEKIFAIADNDEEPDETHGYSAIKKLANQALNLLNHQQPVRDSTRIPKEKKCQAHQKH